ncbi:hypothetical protein GcM1_144006 [Golovinomyces cichoracearum]|uniref:Uncharacterized protein n=1 Tax=Golovinomyces cichoracearum TaxID=62708 RepID=A0A420JBF0_9PEZI|nr:hypothetical protein GcM1_144006 [Golovinomyces cichoracearum]
MDYYINSPTTSTFDESPNQSLDSQGSEPRKLQLKCTTCNKKFITKVEAFQSSNLVKHYRENHHSIAYSKETEKTKKIIDILPNRSTFFNSIKRARSSTLTDFTKEEAYNKIITFLIHNNLSFNILNSSFFKDLLCYYNPDSPSISRRGAKTLLNATFRRALTIFNNDLKRNLDTSGTFSLTFDLWTSRNRDTYLRFPY